MVHGQKSCIDEARDTISAIKPEIVAIELPPHFPGKKIKNIDKEIEKISSNYHKFFDVLQELGLSESYSDQLEDLAIGLSLQGYEFLYAIETANKVGARVEFIDMSRDKIFWEFIKQTYENIIHTQQVKSQNGTEFMIFPGLSVSIPKIPPLTTITKTVFQMFGDWKNTFNSLIKIYGEKDYRKLIENVMPLINSMEGNPVLTDILIENRNRYMVDNILSLLEDSAGEIVIVTGFGHVEGIKSLLKNKLEGHQQRVAS